MFEAFELKIGKRGEIYLTHEVRERVGLIAGEKAIGRIEGDKLIVQPRPLALSSLEKPGIKKKPLTPEELAESRLLSSTCGGGQL
jgi:bifunctional DNA-binding transcriptional regulator/antitoxin component of YhaV-PrlF toxin-antitoxin module